MSSSYDPKEILHLDQTDVEQPTPETTAKDSSQIEVGKPLGDTTPEKTTGEFAGSIWLFSQFIHPEISTKNNELDCHIYFDQTPPYSLS